MARWWSHPRRLLRYFCVRRSAGTDAHKPLQHSAKSSGLNNCSFAAARSGPDRPHWASAHHSENLDACLGRQDCPVKGMNLTYASSISNGLLFGIPTIRRRPRNDYAGPDRADKMGDCTESALAPDPPVARMLRLTERMTSSLTNLSAPPSRLAIDRCKRAVAAKSDHVAPHRLVRSVGQSDVATPSRIGDVRLWNLSWAVQVFFVIGGYIMARNDVLGAPGAAATRAGFVRATGRLVSQYFWRPWYWPLGQRGRPRWLVARTSRRSSGHVGPGAGPHRVAARHPGLSVVVGRFLVCGDRFSTGADLYVALLCLRDFVAWLSRAGAANERMGCCWPPAACAGRAWPCSSSTWTRDGTFVAIYSLDSSSWASWPTRG